MRCGCPALGTTTTSCTNKHTRVQYPPRYKHLVGREAVVPQSGRRIRIIADEYVDREFGTGALKITPGG